MSRLETPIRKNDNVLVTTGKDRGKRGRVLKVVPGKNRLIVEGVNFIKRHTKPNPRQEHQGRHREARGGACTRPTCSWSAPSAASRPASATGARRRPQGAHLPQVRGSGGQMSRLKERYVKEVVPGAPQGVRLQERHGHPEDREGRGEHGPRRGDAERQADRRGRRRGRPHHRPAGRHDPRQEVDRGLQGAPGHAGRRRW